MQPSLGFDHPPNKVYMLRWAFYGLKQAPHEWFSKFSSTILQFGFTSSSYDLTIFVRHTSSGTIMLLLYIDDRVITESDFSGIDDI